MAKAIQVNPNRMELSRLKRRLVVAKRGHKLLKDKQDALVKEFLGRARAVRSLRDEVEADLALCRRDFLLARAQTLPAMLEQALLVTGKAARLSVSRKNVMSVAVPIYTLSSQEQGLGYGLAGTPAGLDLALERFQAVLPRLIRLAEEEKALKLMAAEIERTRRRVNALQHVMVPSLMEAIRGISMKLDEMERANLSRLMRIKEIVRSH
jgi:V/A-type H+-transporting ATPase subunit D